MGRTIIPFPSTSAGCSIANTMARAIASAGSANLARALFYPVRDWGLTVSLLEGPGAVTSAAFYIILFEGFEQRFATDLETMCAPARC